MYKAEIWVQYPYMYMYIPLVTMAVIGLTEEGYEKCARAIE